MSFFTFIGGIFTIGVLLVNAIAILNEERFLVPIGWSASSRSQMYSEAFGQQQEESVKARLIHLISAVRMLLRVPLIAVNALVIAHLIIF